MAAQKGSDMLIKVGNSDSPADFVTVAGLRTKTITCNAEQVDVTNSDSANKMRELLAGAGIKSITIAGAGVFTDHASHETIRAEWAAQTIKDYQVVIPSFGTYEGPFQVTQLQWAGEHNAEATFDVSLESAGDVTFTPA